MRVGLVSGEYPPLQGGVGDFTQALARALCAVGVEVHVMTSGAARRPPRPASDEPEVHTIGPGWSFADLLRTARLAGRLHLDRLNLQYQAAAFGLTAPIHFLPQLASVPCVVTFHDLRVPYLFPKAGRLRVTAVTHLARSAAGAIATDPADAAELRRRGGIRLLAEIPIGSNITPKAPPGYDRGRWRAEHGVGRGEFLLGYFGFLNESKGADTLIEALAVLVNVRKAPVRLVLIGGRTGVSDPTNAAFDARLTRLVARHDLQQRVLGTGFVDAPDVSAAMMACDAVVLPYRDGASLRRGSLLAALAHGCAVITTQPAEPLPDLRDGDNVSLIPPGSAAAIVLAVTQLLDAPELRARLGQAAREAAAAFSWEQIARRTLEFYGRV